ncbi:hypothetical protein Q1W73_03775 [Asticcacaulis sp. ZE23SCel15]|uniref:hypothetical protein n=1 Tax=Asticcacaulis sp. ZE23SCel15 TaxID=3059027 RepID=UPI00265FE5E4|nr:hypothetical protein [Asticcacaulis sp. ZE23SCel15]WKL58109.1 hypothetical protein Q1W73_03775 [Asticcacaulis sp. ZE23SCel15]
MLHLGAAHFGDINFDLSGLSGNKDNCTCALCQRKSAQHPLKVALPLIEGPDDEREFGRHPLQHHFCLTTETGKADGRPFGSTSDFDYLLNATR